MPKTPDRTREHYEDAARLLTGLSAIDHLLVPYPEGGPIGDAFAALVDAVSEEHVLARDEHLAEHDWVYNGDREPSPLIHPDYTDPDQRRRMLVGIVSPAEADLQIETVGPFPMAVDDPGTGGELILNSEEELTEHARDIYGDLFTFVRPMPFADSPGG